MSKVRRRILVAVGVALLASCAAMYFVGEALWAPVPSHVGDAPQGLAAESVEFESESGSSIRGWWVSGEPDHPVVVLAHSLRGNRREMLGRARFLRAAGYAVLLFDAQAHGESSGEQITFGVLEAHDARAAVAFAKERRPEARIGYLGSSLGGAAALLGPEPLDVDALILEAVYPTLREAAHNRIALRVGPLAHLLTPLLLLQVRPRLGVSAASISPINGVASVRAPVLILAGALDEHTTVEQSKRLFAAAPEPKTLWILPQAAHENFHRANPTEYERRVLKFLAPLND